MHKNNNPMHICGTLTRGTRQPTLDGTASQVSTIVAMLESVCNVKGLILTLEPHENGEQHYHFLVHAADVVDFEVVAKARSLFDEWIGTRTANNISVPKYAGRPSPNHQFWMAYITKLHRQGSVLVAKGTLQEGWKEYADAYNSCEGAERSRAIVAMIRAER